MAALRNIDRQIGSGNGDADGSPGLIIYLDDGRRPGEGYCDIGFRVHVDMPICIVSARVRQIEARVARESSIEVLRKPYRAPKANAVCERFIGSMRRECLDHLLVVRDRQHHRVIKEYVEYFNPARPHQGIGQRIPEAIVPQPAWPRRGRLIAVPVLNGLHHDYRRAT